MNLKKIKEGIKKIVAGKKRVVVIVQCRLSSTRLPRKALLPLGGKTILEWTLASMKKVEASKYFLAWIFTLAHNLMYLTDFAML